MFYTTKLYTYNEKQYPIELQWDKFNYEDLIIEIDQVRNWCREGCPNYNANGGCPPYSPTAEDILKNKDFILLTAKLQTVNIRTDTLEEKSKTIEKLLCSFMDSLGYKIKAEYDIDFLNPGHCRGCNSCSIETGCKAPHRRVYSITGVGIMLSDAIENLFSTKLQWFTKDTEPEYVIKIMCFMSNKATNKLLEKLEQIILSWYLTMHRKQ